MTADYSSNQRKAKIKPGNFRAWQSLFYTQITFALERKVPIATACNNCYTSSKNVQEHHFYYDARGRLELWQQSDRKS